MDQNQKALLRSISAFGPHFNPRHTPRISPVEMAARLDFGQIEPF
jgi:hypothetical protein